MPVLEKILADMRAQASPATLRGKARFGIDTTRSLGLTVPEIRQIARQTGKSQALAEELWNTGIHEARILASLVGEAALITRETMNQWVSEFDSWDVCDACCGNLFDRTPYAWPLIREWAASNHEYTRRAAFSMIAALAVHDKAAPDAVFLKALPLLEKYAFDDRNFVRKAVNWALRGIGKRNSALARAAIACAERIHDQGTKPARWIATDALRELRSKYRENPG